MQGPIFCLCPRCAQRSFEVPTQLDAIDPDRRCPVCADQIECYEDRILAAAHANPENLSRELRGDAVEGAIARLQMIARELRSPLGNGTPF